VGEESYVRIALVENKHRIRQAVRNMKDFLAEDSGHNMKAVGRRGD